MTRRVFLIGKSGFQKPASCVWYRASEPSGAKSGGAVHSNNTFLVQPIEATGLPSYHTLSGLALFGGLDGSKAAIEEQVVDDF
jgi:hypothetical protein